MAITAPGLDFVGRRRILATCRKKPEDHTASVMRRWFNDTYVIAAARLIQRDLGREAMRARLLCYDYVGSEWSQISR